VAVALLATASATAASIERGAGPDGVITRALVVLVAIGAAAWWLGRYGTRLLPLLRRDGVNLEARRGVSAESPNPDTAVWLVAHLDSKSQPVSLLARSAAAVAVCLGWLSLALVWVVTTVTPVPSTVFVLLSACAALASVPLLFSRPGARSAGALDNASGVASIVLAARRLDLAAPVGVVITSAEELGLAGARAWVEGAATAVAINCDGVDDHGRLTITAGSIARELLHRTNAVAVLGPDVRIRRALPGILLDSAAFSDRGWAACTISQGTLRSLARVHTERDALDLLSGSGIESTSVLIASLAGAIIADGSSSEYRTGGSESAWNSNA
jgi:hypothetical protein